jgi:limonene-1,2-epoxide hydrolase
MTDATAVVQKFLDSLGPTYDDMCGAFKNLTTDDFIWQNSGLPTCQRARRGPGFPGAVRQLRGHDVNQGGLFTS